MWLFVDMDYTIYIKGELVPVTEEVYRAYYKEKRREKTQIEKDARNGTSSFAEMDLLSSTEPSAETQIIARETHARLRAALAQLTEPERELIRALFFDKIPVAQLARSLEIPRKTLEYRRDKILTRLRKLLK